VEVKMRRRRRIRRNRKNGDGENEKNDEEEEKKKKTHSRFIRNMLNMTSLLSEMWNAKSEILECSKQNFFRH
jgi:hypothetical protein